MVDSNLDPTKQIAPKDEQYNTRMLYYGLFIVGFAGILLVLYHFLIMKWCFGGSPRRGNYHERRPVVASVAVRRFKYEKSKVGLGEGECVVCLGGYEEGEEVKELPKCKHLFHASCIDMWLFSHYDCPLCRAPVEQLGQLAQRNDDVV